MGLLDFLFGTKKKNFFDDDVEIDFDSMIDSELLDSEDFDDDANDLFDSDIDN